jgi:ribosomal protein L40E
MSVTGEDYENAVGDAYDAGLAKGRAEAAAQLDALTAERDAARSSPDAARCGECGTVWLASSTIDDLSELVEPHRQQVKALTAELDAERKLSADVDRARGAEIRLTAEVAALRVKWAVAAEQRDEARAELATALQQCAKVAALETKWTERAALCRRTVARELAKEDTERSLSRAAAYEDEAFLCDAHAEDISQALATPSASTGSGEATRPAADEPHSSWAWQRIAGVSVRLWRLVAQHAPWVNAKKNPPPCLESTVDGPQLTWFNRENNAALHFAIEGERIEMGLLLGDKSENTYDPTDEEIVEAVRATIPKPTPSAQEARGACDHQVKWLYAASGNVYVCSACGDEMPITAAEARKLPYDPALNASPERGTGGDTLADRLYAIGRHVGWDRDGLEHIAVQIFAVADELSGKPTTLHNAAKGAGEP